MLYKYDDFSDNLKENELINLLIDSFNNKEILSVKDISQVKFSILRIEFLLDDMYVNIESRFLTHNSDIERYDVTFTQNSNLYTINNLSKDIFQSIIINNFEKILRSITKECCLGKFNNNLIYILFYASNFIDSDKLYKIIDAFYSDKNNLYILLKSISNVKYKIYKLMNNSYVYKIIHFKIENELKSKNAMFLISNYMNAIPEDLLNKYDKYNKLFI